MGNKHEKLKVMFIILISVKKNHQEHVKNISWDLGFSEDSHAISSTLLIRRLEECGLCETYVKWLENDTQK